MALQTKADITPNGTATALGAAGTMAIWVKLTATGTSCRVGDSNVSATRGVKLQNLVTTDLPRLDAYQGHYDLGQIYVFAASGSDAVSVTYGS